MENDKQLLSPYYAHYYCGRSLVSRKNFRKAIDHLEEALKIRETEGVYFLLFYSHFNLGNFDSCEEILKRTEGGNYPAVFVSGGAAYAKNEKKASAEKSLYWFEKAIALSYPEAFFQLGELYRTGCAAFGADLVKSADCFRRGLELNDPKWNGRFAHSLARVYRDHKEYSLAREFFKKAIDYGFVDSNYDLALLYRDGLGGERDLEQFIEHLSACDNIQAIREAGGVFLTGDYAKPDYEASFDFFSKGARHGDPVCAIMCAGILANAEEYNEKLVAFYLEIAFRNSAQNEGIRNQFDAIEEVLGEKAGDRLWELAEKYWNFRKGSA